MSQQAVRSKTYTAAGDVIEEALEDIGQPVAGQTRSPIKKVVPQWSAILSQFNPSGFPMIKSPEEIAQAGRESIEALTKSSAALANGLNEVNQHMIAIVQKSVTAQSAATKDVLGIKSPSDWVDLHSRWAVELMTSTISHLTHLSQLSTKAMHQAYEPIQTHCDAAFRKISSSSS